MDIIRIINSDQELDQFNEKLKNRSRVRLHNILWTHFVSGKWIDLNSLKAFTSGENYCL
jgi:hypothetical protein